MKKNRNVLVAMSGGIDSSVAAFLLQKMGYNIEGIYFQLIDENEIEVPRKDTKGQVRSGLNNQTDSNLAKVIANKLKIHFQVIDYRKEFEKIVINNFIKKYRLGMTPNPCIVCNEKIKFKLLSYYAKKMNIHFISTGHYARIEKDSSRNIQILKRGLDIRKEQSYFLYRLDQEILSKTIFPLGNLTKKAVEKMAEDNGLKQFHMRESQEICFVNHNNYRQLIESRAAEEDEKGYFVDKSGNILGRHKGIAFYTIGQRRKIGLSFNNRKYIVKINQKDNNITIGDEEDLYRRECILSDICYIFNEYITTPTKLKIQIRYNAMPVNGTLFPLKQDRLKIVFDKPQRAVTPGQSAVFYMNNSVLGGGIISRF